MSRLVMKQLKVIFVMTVLMLVLLAASGCATSLPSGGEFQKETTPSATKDSNKSDDKVSSGKVKGLEIYENHDPFQPLTGPGATTQPVTTSTSSSEIGADGETTTTVITSQSQVRLVSIEGSSATIRVEDTDYAGLQAGDTFADSYKLQTIGSGSVSILFGDNQYTLYLGETISVK